MEAKDQKKTFLEVLKDNLKTIIIVFLLLFSIFSSIAALINIADLPLFLLSLLNILFYLVIFIFNNIEKNNINPLQLFINII